MSIATERSSDQPTDQRSDAVQPVVLGSSYCWDLLQRLRKKGVECFTNEDQLLLTQLFPRLMRQEDTRAIFKRIVMNAKVDMPGERLCDAIVKQAVEQGISSLMRDQLVALLLHPDRWECLAYGVNHPHSTVHDSWGVRTNAESIPDGGYSKGH